jgi:hypothetical protein
MDESQKRHAAGEVTSGRIGPKSHPELDQWGCNPGEHNSPRIGLLPMASKRFIVPVVLLTAATVGGGDHYSNAR